MAGIRVFKVLLLTLFIFLAIPAFGAEVHLVWDPSPGDVTGYRIYYGTSQGNYPNKIDVGNVTDYVVTGLEEGVTYYFVARAYNQYGESENSNEVTWASSSTDTTPPGDISAFTATPGDSQVELSWTNPNDNDFAGVMIRYRTDTWPVNYNDGQLVCNKTSAPGASDSFVHTGLQNDTTYYYAAFTYDTSGNYSHTAKVSATPRAQDHTPPLPPTGVTVE